MSVKKMINFLIAVAIIYLSTIFFKYEVGNLGYINVSFTAIMILAVYFSPAYAMLLAGIPAALADITLGYGYYAIYTFVIKTAEGFLISKWAAGKKPQLKHYFILAMTELVSYVAVDYVLYGRSMLMFSFVYNLVQIALAILLLYLYNHIVKK